MWTKGVSIFITASRHSKPSAFRFPIILLNVFECHKCKYLLSSKIPPEYKISTNKHTMVFWCSFITGRQATCYGHFLWPSSGRYKRREYGSYNILVCGSERNTKCESYIVGMHSKRMDRSYQAGIAVMLFLRGFIIPCITAEQRLRRQWVTCFPGTSLSAV
jgi:hypothetical protein